MEPRLFQDVLHKLLKGRPRLLLAVSGGPDSMALLDLAWAAKTDTVVGHVDHGLRGRASRADADFVCREARRRGLPFRLARVPTAAFAAREKRGLEEAARILRYNALARMAKAARCGAVVTAHTLDDQAETVMMNLIRGAGPDGLGGMAPSSPWPVGKGPRLLRPFLDILRRELVSYLKARRVPFRTDATNARPVFFRNRVRPVLQAWEKERPGFFERLGRLSEILRDEESYWDALVGKARGRRLEGGSFKRYHKVLQRRLLRRMFGLASFAAVERARAFVLDPASPARTSIPRGWLEKKGGTVSFRPLYKEGK